MSRLPSNLGALESRTRPVETSLATQASSTGLAAATKRIDALVCRHQEARTIFAASFTSIASLQSSPVAIGNKSTRDPISTLSAGYQGIQVQLPHPTMTTRHPSHVARRNCRGSLQGDQRGKPHGYRHLRVLEGPSTSLTLSRRSLKEHGKGKMSILVGHGRAGNPGRGSIWDR